MLGLADLSVRSRHCEERSDEAIQGGSATRSGLLRYARNDDERVGAARRGSTSFVALEIVLRAKLAMGQPIHDDGSQGRLSSNGNATSGGTA
jgi:hypothetical protein